MSVNVSSPQLLAALRCVGECVFPALRVPVVSAEAWLEAAGGGGGQVHRLIQVVGCLGADQAEYDREHDLLSAQAGLKARGYTRRQFYAISYPEHPHSNRELLMALRFLLRQKSVVEMYERAIAVRARELVDPDDPLALEHVLYGKPTWNADIEWTGLLGELKSLRSEPEHIVRDLSSQIIQVLGEISFLKRRCSSARREYKAVACSMAQYRSDKGLSALSVAELLLASDTALRTRYEAQLRSLLQPIPQQRLQQALDIFTHWLEEVVSGSVEVNEATPCDNDIFDLADLVAVELQVNQELTRRETEIKLMQDSLSSSPNAEQTSSLQKLISEFEMRVPSVCENLERAVVHAEAVRQGTHDVLQTIREKFSNLLEHIEIRD